MSAKNAKRKRSQREPITKMEPVHPIVDWDKIYQAKTFKIEFTVSKDATPEEIRQAYINALKKYQETEKQKHEQEVRRLVLELINPKGGDAMQENTPIFHGDCCQ